jgi:hypothetical protein
LKEEALNRTLWRTRFGRGYGPVVRQTTEWMNEWNTICEQNNSFRVWNVAVHKISTRL